MLQTALMFNFRSEKWIGPDVPVCGIRAELRRHEAIDAGSERGLEKRVLCSNCGWYVPQARNYGVLVSEDFTQSIIVVVVHFHDVDR
jgi:hypothetical protein